ncbi:MAG: hypothetical protein IJS60_03685 [Abditibacteriota bacterium]|nr:hypothetical protein [Abditibacteriota bacterium]
MKKLLIILCFLLVATSLMAYTYRPIETNWQFITDEKREGIEKGYLNNDYDTSSWISIPCDVPWESVIGEYDGCGWYKRVDTFTKEDLENDYIYMKFNGVDEEATVYVNGKLAIEHTVKKTHLSRGELWLTPFMVNIKPFLREGENQIKVIVFDESFSGGIYDKTSYILTDDRIDFNYTKSIDIVSLNPDFEYYMRIALKPTGGVKPFSLFWFSDLHGDAPHLERLVHFYEHYNEYFDDALCTGDNVFDSPESGFAFWGDKGGEKIMFTTGNHDSLNNKLEEPLLTQKEVYDLYFAKYIKNWGVNYKEGQTYYYKDYEDKGVRLICLDAMRAGEDQTAQCEWLKALLKEAKEKKLSVVIATHLPFVYEKYNFVDTEFNNFDKALMPQPWYACYKNIKIYQDAVDEFMKSGGDFVCFICGHYHSDHIFYNEEYPDQLQIIVGVAAPWDDIDTTLRIQGTKSMDLANAFIVDTATKTLKIIRVGADMDKYFRKRDLFSYDYKNKKVIK